MAPLPASGSVSICHIVGSTPEAPTLEQAFGNQKPADVIKVDKEAIEETKALHALASTETADMCILGCPHCTIQEIRNIAVKTNRKKIAGRQKTLDRFTLSNLLSCTNHGYCRTIEDAGGVVSSSCMATIPDSPIPDGVKTLATNSFKAAALHIPDLPKGG